MNLRDFIKERIVFIIINSLILLFTALLLMVLKVDSFAVLFIKWGRNSNLSYF